MQTTQWMVTLLMACALGAGPAMAADTAETKARLGQGSAAVQGENDACPLHNNKGALGKGGEQCSCPHGDMHHHHMKHMSKHGAMHGGKPEICDPAKEAAKPFKPVS